jgi:AcrR family transcriptional regulator
LLPFVADIVISSEHFLVLYRKEQMLLSSSAMHLYTEKYNKLKAGGPTLMRTAPNPVAKPLGRPRTFHAEDALDAATRVFRRQGFQGASLNDLTAAMGINRPSCYAAFGDKEALFLKVLERYTKQLTEFYRAAFAQPTARAVATYLLEQTIELISSNDMDPCLFGSTTIPGDPLGDAIKASRQALDRSLKRRLTRAQRAGDLPQAADPAALAAILSTTLRSFSGQSTEGVSRASLQAQAETLLQLFPLQHVP